MKSTIRTPSRTARRLGLVSAGSALALVLGAVAAPTAVAKGSDERAESPLVRVDSPSDPDARGEVRIRSKRGDERFEVRAKKLSPGLDVELWMDDDGALEFVADLEPSNDVNGDDSTSYKYKARLRDDRGSLPFDAMSVDELSGRHVEIRADGETLLVGRVPPLGVSPKQKSDERSELDPTDDALGVSSEARARARLRSRPAKGDERFEVKITDFPGIDSSSLLLFVEDPADPGVLVEIGAFVADHEDPAEHKFRRRTQKGEALPFGVQSVVELHGLAVEIRDAGDDTLYFEGDLPGSS